MSINDKVAENWVTQKINRLHKETRYTGSRMFCVPNFIYSYGTHYTAGIRTDQFFRKRRIYFANTESGYNYGRQSGTNGHVWLVRDAIKRHGGIIISLDITTVNSVYGYGSHNLKDSRILDINNDGHAVFQIGEDYFLVDDQATILLKEPQPNLSRAKKSLLPKELGTEYEEYANYFFKPTGMDDKAFAAMHRLTIKAVRKWTTSSPVKRPNISYGAAWNKIKARVFGNNPVAAALGVDNNPSPYVSGVIYKDNYDRWGKTLFNTDGKWWQVLPMECNGYLNK